MKVLVGGWRLENNQNNSEMPRVERCSLQKRALGGGGDFAPIFFSVASKISASSYVCL